MNATIEHLTQICKDHRFKEKLLFVPSYSIGHQLGECLAKTGTSWINLRMTTAVGFAQEMAALDICKSGIRHIESQARLIIIEKLYRNNEISTTGNSYFKKAEEIPGILKYLSNAVHEMRMAGLAPEDIDPGAFITPEKGNELIQLLDSYNHFIEENRLIDHAGLLQLSIRKFNQGTKPEEDSIVMVLSDFALTRLEKELIRMAGGKAPIIIDHTLPSNLDFPERLFGLPRLSTPERVPDPFKDVSPSIFHAVGESNEVREVFRRILKQQIPLDDVELLVTTVDPYIPMIYEIASSLSVPATFMGGIPVTFTRPGRALILYLKWQAEDFLDSYLRRLFSGGYLYLKGGKQKGEIPSSNRAARIIRDAAIGYGRERYVSRLKGLEDAYLLKAKKKEDKKENPQWEKQIAGNAAWVRGFVNKLMSTIPEPNPDGTSTIKEICTGAVRFVKDFCRTASEADAAAKSKLVDFLESLAFAPSFPDQANETIKRLIEEINGISVYHSNPKPGYVHVAHYRSGGYSGRTHTFVLGLNQGRFPGTPIQDPVILDAERQKIGNDLALSSQLLHENLYLMAKLIGALSGNVTLSYSCRDLRENRELFPSSTLLDVYRLITADCDGDYHALLQFLSTPAGFIPDRDVLPLTDWEWWLAQKQYKNESVCSCYPNLLEGQKAEKEREGPEFGNYDGWIPSLKGALDPLKQDLTLSCSRLESLAKCPYAYFIRNVLKVEPLKERDMSIWLDPLQRGELLHEVFRRFMEELKARGERPELKRHLQFLNDITSEEIKYWKIEALPPNQFVFDQEKADIMQALEIFLKNEERHCHKVSPSFFEVPFGLIDDQQAGLSDADPVMIKLDAKGSFKLRGRIDRIDSEGEHRYQVWDYKTGGTWGYDEHSYLNQGKHLQHALYAIAAEKLLREKVDKEARVVRAGYFFPGARGEGRRISKDKPVREELNDVLEDLFTILKEGVFPALIDKNSCGFCEYQKICGGFDLAVKHTKGKLKSDKKLEPLRRLKDREKPR